MPLVYTPPQMRLKRLAPGLSLPYSPMHFDPISMFAIVSIAGFQEKVSEGETLEVPLQDAEKGKKLTFDQVLLIAKDGGEVVIGQPFVSGASIEAKVVEHGRDDKIRVFRMRRRKRFQKTRGHRQDFTTIEVVKIHA